MLFVGGSWIQMTHNSCRDDTLTLMLFSEHPNIKMQLDAIFSWHSFSIGHP
jgi:hypothetical protein